MSTDTLETNGRLVAQLPNKTDDSRFFYLGLRDTIRSFTVFCVYMLLTYKVRCNDDMTWYTIEFSGVFVLCYLAAIVVGPSDQRYKNAGGSNLLEMIQNLTFSRKTALLTVYILAWVSVCDSLREAQTAINRDNAKSSR